MPTGAQVKERVAGLYIGNMSETCLLTTLVSHMTCTGLPSLAADEAPPVQPFAISSSCRVRWQKSIGSVIPFQWRAHHMPSGHLDCCTV